MNIMVLAGGDSSEREVSLRSGAAVSAALQAAGHTVRQFDPATQEISTEFVRSWDVIFLALHGAGGEDGQIQATLEGLGAKFVGSGSEASELCFDKWQYRQEMATGGVPLADGSLVHWDDFTSHRLTQAPYVLKPIKGGSSIDTYVVRDITQAPLGQIEDTFRRYPTMLIEQLIEGIEITVGMLGDQALPVIEIIPPANGEFDYENKYNGASQELCPPEHLNQDTQAEAQALAKRIHQLCDCRGMSRTDMIVTPEQKLVTLETNTLPGMTDQSLLPKAAATAGIPMPELCDKLVQLAVA